MPQSIASTASAAATPSMASAAPSGIISDTHASALTAASIAPLAHGQGQEVDENQLNLPEIAPPVYQLPSLASIRLQQSRTVEQAANALRLSVSQINAMENQQWQSLPGPAYIKGFLRNYTKYLGIETAAYIEQYEQSINGKLSLSDRDEVSVAHKASASAAPHKPIPSAIAALQQSGASVSSNAARPMVAAIKQSIDKPTVLKDDTAALSSFGQSSHTPSNRGLISVVLGLLVATAAFLMYWERAVWLPSIEPFVTRSQSLLNSALGDTSGNGNGNGNQLKTLPAASSAPANVPPNGVVEAAATAQTPVTPPVADTSRSVMPTALSALPADSRVIDVTVEKAAWLELRDATGAVIDSGTKPAGSRYQVEGKAPIHAIIGAADAVSIYVNGKPLDIVSSASGNVARVTIQ